MSRDLEQLAALIQQHRSSDRQVIGCYLADLGAAARVVCAITDVVDRANNVLPIVLLALIWTLAVLVMRSRRLSEMRSESQSLG